jgi:hypothetical protein
MRCVGELVRALLYALWGISGAADPPPRVLIERGDA